MQISLVKSCVEIFCARYLIFSQNIFFDQLSGGGYGQMFPTAPLILPALSLLPAFRSRSMFALHFRIPKRAINPKSRWLSACIHAIRPPSSQVYLIISCFFSFNMLLKKAVLIHYVHKSFTCLNGIRSEAAITCQQNLCLLNHNESTLRFLAK